MPLDAEYPSIQSHCSRWNIFCYTVVVKSSIHPHLKMGCILLYCGSQIIHPSTLLKMGRILLNHGSQTIHPSCDWMDGWLNFHGITNYIPSSSDVYFIKPWKSNHPSIHTLLRFTLTKFHHGDLRPLYNIIYRPCHINSASNGILHPIPAQVVDILTV
jgi:hypothetical protein